jgi:thiol-disulfide isomerase/thioredoxin
MSKVRKIKTPARVGALNNVEQSGRLGSDATEERVHRKSNLDMDLGEVPFAPQEPAPEQPGGLFGTRRRQLTLLGSALALALLFSMAVWLFQVWSLASTGSTGEPVGTSYPITSAGADITGLGTGPKVGQLAPDFALNDVHTGRPIRLSSLRGKPVWINFWASWCPPCKAELPDMKQVYARYEAKGLVLLGVDMQEDPAVVKPFASDNGYTWNIAVDSDGSVTNTYYVFSIPSHIFVGGDGVIKSIQIGTMTQAMMEEHLSKIMQ